MIRKRFLEERAFLKFDFPLGSDSKTTVTIPFYENPVIKEVKQSSLARYALLSRSSELYSYLGAKSRRLTVQFNITLPHLYEVLSDFKSYINIKTGLIENKEENKKRFLNPFSNPGTGEDAPTDYTPNHAFLARQKFEKLLTENGYSVTGEEGNNFFLEFVDSLNQGVDGVNEALADFWGTKESEDKNERAKYDADRNKIINVMLFWINIVRASCLNSARNPSLGPPIIRLTNGVMYDEVPTICTKYSINVDQAAGFDLKTLMPRRVVVVLDLEEIRTGSRNYSYRNPDGLPGFEDPLSRGTIDPGFLRR
jgi:hypothetical protein